MMIGIRFFPTAIIDQNSRGRCEVMLFYFDPQVELTGFYLTMFLAMLDRFLGRVMDSGNCVYSERLPEDAEGYSRLATYRRISKEPPYSVAVSITLDQDDQIDEFEFEWMQATALETIDEFNRAWKRFQDAPRDY